VDGTLEQIIVELVQTAAKNARLEAELKTLNELLDKDKEREKE